MDPPGRRPSGATVVLEVKSDADVKLCVCVCVCVWVTCHMHYYVYVGLFIVITSGPEHEAWFQEESGGEAGDEGGVTQHMEYTSQP